MRCAMVKPLVGLLANCGHDEIVGVCLHVTRSMALTELALAAMDWLSSERP